MDYQFTIYSFCFLIASFVSLYAAFLAWQRRLVMGARELSLMSLAAFLWSFAIIFETAGTTLAVKIFWSKIEYFGAVSAPVLYLIFVLRYTGKDHLTTAKRIIALSIVPVLTLICAFTNEYHGLLWSGFSPISAKTNFIIYSHGAWFWIGYVGYNYLLLFWATIRLFRFISFQALMFRWQAWIFVVAGICPWFASAMYISGINFISGMDITPLSTVLSSVLMVYSILFVRFLDIVPVAREQLLEILPDGILALDGQNRVQDMNKAAIKLLGLTKISFLGEPVSSLAVPDKRLLHAISGMELVDPIDISYGDKVKTLIIIKQPVRLHPGSRLLILRDITQQKQSELEILRRETLLEAIAKATALLVRGENLEKSIHGALGIIGKATEANRVYIFRNHEESGYRMPLMTQSYEWTDGTVTPQIDNPDLKNVPYEFFCPRWYEVLSSGQVIVGNIRDFPETERNFLRAQEIQSILVVPYFVDKQFGGFLGFDDCFSERKWNLAEERILGAAANTLGAAYLRKQQQEELVIAKERAEESDRLKSAFLANMSHEIRTPMNGILGFSELLKEPNLSGEEQQKYISIIEKSGNRMLNIINDIVDISKIESGMMRVSLSEANINEQMDFLYTFFKHEVEGKGMQFSCIKGLPFSEAGIRTDREKLYAILTNLIKNAIKFSAEGLIEFGYEKMGQCLEFFVRDSGIGIEKSRQSAIFDRFVQADIADKKVYQGAGLGLSISKAFVEMLGGRIWVESEEGSGSVFYFTLPYQQVSNIPSAPSGKASEEISGKATPVQMLNILIAEDDRTSEMVLKYMLEKVSRNVLFARTGLDVVEICRNNPDLDLVLMDIKMPGLDGYEATRQIRKFNQKVVIIAQTAYALTGDKENALAAGCSDYLSKPIMEEELLDLIHKYF